LKHELAPAVQLTNNGTVALVSIFVVVRDLERTMLVGILAETKAGLEVTELVP
jgi:hypothetical protein